MSPPVTKLVPGKLYVVKEPLGICVIRPLDTGDGLSRRARRFDKKWGLIHMDSVIMYVQEVHREDAPTRTAVEGDHAFVEYHIHRIMDGGQIWFMGEGVVGSLQLFEGTEKE